MKEIVGVDVIICKLKEKVMYLHSSPPTLIFISCLAFPAFPSLFSGSQTERAIQKARNKYWQILKENRSQQPGVWGEVYSLVFLPFFG